MTAVTRTGRAAKVARRLASDCSGATAIEYGLIAAFMGLSIVTVAAAVGAEVNRLFETVVALIP